MILCFGLAVLVCLTAPWGGGEEDEWHPTVTSFTIDGVGLGDGLAKISSAWGRVENLPGLEGGLFVLPRPGSSSRPGQYAEVDGEGRVRAVTGGILRFGGDIILKRGDYPERALHRLGRPIRESRVMAGIRQKLCWTFRKQGVLIDVIVPADAGRHPGDRERPETLRKVTEISISYPLRSPRTPPH